MEFGCVLLFRIVISFRWKESVLGICVLLDVMLYSCKAFLFFSKRILCVLRISVFPVVSFRL